MERNTDAVLEPMTFRLQTVSQSFGVAVSLAAMVAACLGGHGDAAEREAPQSRPKWTASRVNGTPSPPPPFATRRTHPHLAFNHPTEVAVAPGSDRIFVVEQHGKVFSFPDHPDCRSADLLVDANQLVANLAARTGETIVLEGAFGLAFHPDFTRNRFCYLCYSARYTDGKRGQHPNGARLVRLTVSAESPPRCDPASEVEILTWMGGGHPGGCLRFGPDEYLYISTADAGTHAPADGHRTGQDVTDLLSSILRIDVNREEQGRGYAIPPDNPLLKYPDARPEIYAYGVRNAWKMSFDRVTGELWAGDVGLELWEMVYRVRPGDNYGWSVTDGSHPFHTDWPRGPTPIVPPLLEMSHSDAASITGGFVYRGRRLPELAGTYVFGDWETRRIWGISAEGDAPGPVRDLADPTLRIIAFGEKHDGELLIADYDAGSLHELVRNDAAGSPATFPRKLSETGLFADTAVQTPMPGVLPFAINAEVWADHATAQRFVGIPGDGTIGLYAEPQLVAGTNFNRMLHFPAGTVLAKTFAMEMEPDRPDTARRIETQLLHYDGVSWRGYTYAWNDDQTDADLVTAEGKQIDLEISDATAPGGRREQTWRFSSRSECVRCHNPWADHALGFNLAQLNREVSVGGHTENQLHLFRALGLIDDRAIEKKGQPPTLPGPESRLPRLARDRDPAASIDSRARAYLHANCGHCHRFGGGGSAAIMLSHEVPAAEMRAIDERPMQGDFGIPDPRIIAAGDPFRSTLFYRVSTTGPGRMPHIGSEIVDTEGVRLLHDWIAGIAASSQSVGDAPTAAAARNDTAPRSLTTTRDALASAFAVQEGRLPDGERAQVLEAASSHPDPIIAALFERYRPRRERVRRLGTDVDPAVILGREGDVGRGRDLYRTSNAVQCRTCHVAEAVGREVGPRLDGIARKADRGKLLESILYPSKTIDHAYQSWVVETTQGRAISGLLVSRSDADTVIRLADGSQATIPAAEIDAMHPLATSLMPEQLLRDLTAEQAADLLAYLESLH